MTNKTDCDPIIFYYVFSSVNASAFWCVPDKNITEKSIINAGSGGCFGESVPDCTMWLPVHPIETKMSPLVGRVSWQSWENSSLTNFCTKHAGKPFILYFILDYSAGLTDRLTEISFPRHILLPKPKITIAKLFKFLFLKGGAAWTLRHQIKYGKKN